MIAERVPSSPFLRVYDDGGSFAAGSPIRFVVGIKTKREQPGWAFLEAGIGTISGEVWRALDRLLGAEGYIAAEWEVVDLVNGKPRPRVVRRKIKSLTKPLPASSVLC